MKMGFFVPCRTFHCLVTLHGSGNNAHVTTELQFGRSSEEKAITRRERQVMRLMALRATNTEIAWTLGISAHTARHHVQRVLEKLGVTSRSAVRDIMLEQSAAGRKKMGK